MVSLGVVEALRLVFNAARVEISVDSLQLFNCDREGSVLH